jgi:hypothetical protein
MQDESKISRLTASLQIGGSLRRQVDQFQYKSKTSRLTKGGSRRKIELGNTSRPKKVEKTKVEFLKSVFVQVKSVQERSNIKVEVEENLNTSRVQAEARWVN